MAAEVTLLNTLLLLDSGRGRSNKTLLLYIVFPDFTQSHNSVYQLVYVYDNVKAEHAFCSRIVLWLEIYQLQFDQKVSLVDYCNILTV
jgi:hypothetical protein